MNKSVIKICGIKETKIIDCCVANKVNYFGLVFYEKSPRYIKIKDAINLIDHAKKKKIIPVGVFVDHPIEEIHHIVSKTSINYIQLHGNEDVEYIKILKKGYDLKIIKSIGIQERIDLLEIDKMSNCDYYMFDYKPKKNELPGGNAKSFDWSIIKDINIKKPWFISGGININNIDEIKKKLFPYGIDISSGVEEKPGIKSATKINNLMKKFNE